MKTQEMYLLVFVTRYLDLFYNLHIYSLLSVYNWVMKIIFIASTASILYLMRVRYRATYDKERDTFRVAFLIVPSALLAILWNEEFSFVEILWAFSIYLEAVAILPQIFMLHRTGEVDVLTGDYVFTLGGYRAFYLLNWIYRLLTQEGYRQWIVWVAGIVQTLVYCDFFYYYALRSAPRFLSMLCPPYPHLLFAANGTTESSRCRGEGPPTEPSLWPRNSLR
jgi:ER lumen protein retaining receptor